MALRIIIDGYNLIRQSPSLSSIDRQDIEMGREALLEMLFSYKKLKHHRITVVFDGTEGLHLSEQKENYKGIHVIYSHREESADTVIKRLAAKYKDQTLIVSSDHEVLTYAVSQGAATISSREFEEKIAMATYMDVKGVNLQQEQNSGWVPTTKKKGPRKKLSKRMRKRAAKVRKL